MSDVAYDPATIERWQTIRQEELDAEAIYRALANSEHAPERRRLFEELADDEGRHAAHWEDRLRTAHVDPGAARPGQRARLLSKLAGDFADTVVVPIMRDREFLSTEAYLDESREFAADEERHAKALAALVGNRRGEPIGRALARLQRGRAAGGNALRAAVLGVNDGLVSNASLVMGVAGAGVASKDILITGVAGLIAGACSMAMGEWVSVQSSRELVAHELQIEQQHLVASAEEEQAELALVYEQKGLHPREARYVAERLSADPTTALDTHAREELGIDPAELGGSPWVAAGASFVLFVLGAIVPIVPFVFFSGNTAVAVALALSALVLFGIGAAITLLTGQSVLLSGARQLAFGGAAFAVTYGIGVLFGTAVG
ncbi:MAG TPA: VIT1/CCC1 transporter family protein [Gaiella sp.]|jgi:VIT1/CCC1 family predicted Fe2+/Mn2+ transporter|nr:VIT1/CCC1 transporter family protein [Gaiella sp.]